MTRGNMCKSKYLFLVTCKKFDFAQPGQWPSAAMAKGGIADSKDSVKHQISLQKVKKPKPTC